MADYLREVRELRPAAVDPAGLLTLSEAAELLGLSPSAVADLMLRGTLTRYVDRSEPNPRKANRVLRSDVEAEIARRRGRRGDARLRGKGRRRA